MKEKLKKRKKRNARKKNFKIGGLE